VPVQRFESLEDAARALWLPPGDPRIWEALIRRWRIHHALGPKGGRPAPGVYRYRALEEKQRAAGGGRAVRTSEVILPGMTSRVGPKGQVVIPKELRDRLGIRPGDEVVFSLVDGGVLVEPAGRGRDLRGAFSGAGLVEALEAEHRDEVARGR
jgi:AbrB family looped-hinge helix DNA binding protein